jgi:PAS domain S-box-containing protein
VSQGKIRHEVLPLKYFTVKHKILLFENNLDLRHLRITFENLEYDAVFANSVNDFTTSISSAVFDIIVISFREQSAGTEEISDLISNSQNSSTPVLLVTDSASISTDGETSMGNNDLITFPFTPGEIIFRIRNIIRRSKTESFIHNSLNKLRLLLNTVPVAIVQTDEHGGFEKINTRFTELMEMDEAQLKEENFFRMCHPEDYFLKRKTLDRLLKREADKLAYEIRLINNEGKTIICKVKATVAWTANDHFNFFAFAIEKVS